MPIYRTLGKIPPKRHTVFRQPSGGLYYEHLIGSLGFSGPASLMYHIRRPTTILESRKIGEAQLEAETDDYLRMRHFRLAETPAVKSATLNRTPMLFNREVVMSIVKATTTDDFIFRNGQADEIVYVSEGDGVLESQMGELDYRSGDYLVIPRGINYRLRFEKPSLFLVIESIGHVHPPSRYRGETGQFLEHSPFCERDIRGPSRLIPLDVATPTKVVVKHNDAFTETLLDHHPFDVVGWDGHYYPYALSIHDFEPITGSLHQPPPVHQTFASDGFVICSFVPRLFDFHPDAVPAPYNHSNAMSDEILYYANNEFMSRKGIGYGSLTLHPGGLPHGPHPGRTEASIGKKRTDELAVMLDTFRPLAVAKPVVAFEDPAYARSWLGD